MAKSKRKGKSKQHKPKKIAVQPVVKNKAEQQTNKVAEQPVQNEQSTQVEQVALTEKQLLKAQKKEMKVKQKAQAKIDKEKAEKLKKEQREKAGKVSLGRRIKETGSEIKKVSWPSFKEVCKKTGVVIAVVIFFAVVLVAFDALLSWLYTLLIGS